MHKTITRKISDTARDKSRQPDAKGRAMTRKAARRAKSARIFLAFAFPVELAF